jgi:hypothetical protein
VSGVERVEGRAASPALPAGPARWVNGQVIYASGGVT